MYLLVSKFIFFRVLFTIESGHSLLQFITTNCLMITLLCFIVPLSCILLDIVITFIFYFAHWKNSASGITVYAYTFVSLQNHVVSP